MNKFTHLLRFLQQLFDERDAAGKESGTIEGILRARSPRLSDITRRWAGRDKSASRIHAK